MLDALDASLIGVNIVDSKFMISSIGVSIVSMYVNLYYLKIIKSNLQLHNSKQPKATSLD